ncbi:MAG TPA: hypothetical protein VFR41_04235 [Acidimicrobiia bacterium]|nr:hypothetical protein [Acidimicrobiia bacterium]
MEVVRAELADDPTVDITTTGRRTHLIAHAPMVEVTFESNAAGGCDA